MNAAQRIRADANEATRKALLSAGLEETVARGGLEPPSIDAICARAGFTRGAFYVHFRDREHFEAEMFEWVLNDILRSLWVEAVQDATDVREIVRRFSQRLKDRNWPDLHGDIRAGYLAVLRGIMAGNPVQKRHATLMGEVLDMLEYNILSGQKEGTLRVDVEARQLATILLLTAIATIVWDDIGIDLDAPSVAESLITLVEDRRPTT
jgi:AcrR family transcriptional regulator